VAYDEAYWRKAIARSLGGFQSEGNRAEAAAYLAKLASEDADLSTQANVAKILARFSNATGTPWREVTKREIESYFATTALGVRTKDVHKVNLKAFYRWLEGGGETYPDKVKGLKMKRMRSAIQREDLLTWEQHIVPMLKAGTNTRDLAIVASLFDSGMRPGEFLGLRVGSVRLERQWVTLTLPETGSRSDGFKTGRRETTLVRALPYLAQWLAVHPYGDDPSAPLWIGANANQFTKGRTGPPAPLSDHACKSLIQTLARSARITGRAVNLKLFRHSRATEVAILGWNEEKMRVFFGWAPGSPMPSIYMHIAAEDVKNQVLRDHGIEVEAPQKEEKKDFLRCPRCARINGVTHSFCFNCSYPLAPEKAATLQMLHETAEPVATSLSRKMLKGTILDSETVLLEFAREMSNLSDGDFEDRMDKIERLLRAVRGSASA
jgi:integrase